MLRWSMLVFRNKVKWCWMRRPLIDLILSRSAVLMSSETTTHRHVRIFDWLTKKRPQKAWLSSPVVTHQNNSTRCSLRSRQIFRQFVEYAAAVLNNGGHIYGERLAKCIGWSSVELNEFRAKQKSCGPDLFTTAFDSC